MAIQDYVCLNINEKDSKKYCVFKIEVWEHAPYNEKAPEKCPKCGGKIERGIKNSGIDFVGPGFYINDYGKHAYKKRMSISEQADVLTGNKDPY